MSANAPANSPLLDWAILTGCMAASDCLLFLTEVLEINYITEEEREKALVKLMVKIIVADVLKKGREQFPNDIEEDHGD